MVAIDLLDRAVLGEGVAALAVDLHGHDARVFVSTLIEHRANQTSAASEALVERNARSCTKVPSLLFLRFRDLRKFNFADFAFSLFRSGECGPRLAGQRWGELTEK